MKNRAFTLIELILAVFVTAVGTVGAFAVLQKVIVSTTFSSSRLVASYLAQEGIEVIRNIRDTNWVEGATNWDADITQDSPSKYLDYQSDVFPDATCTGKDYLDYNDTSGYYECSSYGKFQRTVTVNRIYENFGGVDFTVLEVIVEVEWNELGSSHKVIVQENLYEWYQ
jgi:prepilin-type N-terminal cleavage/methylation domain-containing protein